MDIANSFPVRSDASVSRRALLAAGLVPFAGPALASPASAAAAVWGVDYVDFADVTPQGLTLTQSWNAMGVDDAGRVYIVWTATRADGREDSALFRYLPERGTKEFLGTFIDAATAQGNVRAGEQLPKGHTHLVQVGRKLYMASQGFHDFKAGLETLPTYRGAHLFSYDLDSGALRDETAGLPGGVLIENQGIVALAHSPEHGVLVGLSHPHGDLVIYDLRTAKVRRVVKGIPWQPNHVVSREIVVTRTGKVYTYRGSEDPKLRSVKNEVWVYDLAKNTMKRTGQKLVGGFWNGQAQTRSRDTVYLTTVSGELYRLDVKKGRFAHVGHFADPADLNGPKKYRVVYLYGVSLDAAEKTLVGAPIIAPTVGTGPTPTRLTTYDITRKKFTKRGDLAREAFTGSNNRDKRGNIYMAAFDWDKNCRLAVIKPPR